MPRARARTDTEDVGQPTSIRFVRGRSTPAIRAILAAPSQPCRCLCFGFEQRTRTTPRRRTILHLSHMRRTDVRTFIALPDPRRRTGGDAGAHRIPAVPHRSAGSAPPDRPP